MSKRKNYVWVVETEMRNGRWLPTSVMGLTRGEVRPELRGLSQFTSQKFRLRKYEVTTYKPPSIPCPTPKATSSPSTKP